MNEGFEFELVAVESKPESTHKKGSKFDVVLDRFITSKNKIAKLQISGTDAHKLRVVIKRRIEAQKEYSNIDASVVSGVLYLENKSIK